MGHFPRPLLRPSLPRQSKMSLAKSLVIACSVLAVLAAPSTLLSKRFEDHVVHEERTSLPHKWVERSNVLDKTRTIPVRINLVQNNMGEKAEELLMSVSHPESPKYGEHYGPHDIADLVRPFSQASYESFPLTSHDDRFSSRRRKTPWTSLSSGSRQLALMFTTTSITTTGKVPSL